MATSSIQPVSGFVDLSSFIPLSRQIEVSMTGASSLRAIDSSSVVSLFAPTDPLALSLFDANGFVRGTAPTELPAAAAADTGAGAGATAALLNPAADALAAAINGTNATPAVTVAEQPIAADSTIPEDLAAAILLQSRLADDVTTALNTVANNPSYAGAASSLYLSAAIYRFQAEQTKEAYSAQAAAVQPVIPVGPISAISEFGIGNSNAALQ